MTLKEYMRKNGVTRRQLAEFCGVHTNTVYNWANQGVVPRFNQMLAIKEFTMGDVGPEDFYNQKSAK